MGEKYIIFEVRNFVVVFLVGLTFSVPRPQVERVNLWQVLKKFSNDIDLNQEVRDSILQ
jgi:hypothetical protein